MLPGKRVSDLNVDAAGFDRTVRPRKSRTLSIFR
jgi:hypothetical protein